MCADVRKGRKQKKAKKKKFRPKLNSNPGLPIQNWFHEILCTTLKIKTFLCLSDLTYFVISVYNKYFTWNQFVHCVWTWFFLDLSDITKWITYQTLTHCIRTETRISRNFSHFEAPKLQIDGFTFTEFFQSLRIWRPVSRIFSGLQDLRHPNWKLIGLLSRIFFQSLRIWRPESMVSRIFFGPQDLRLPNCDLIFSLPRKFFSL